MIYLPSIRAEPSQSGHSAGIHRTPARVRGEVSGRGAESCPDERSGETRAGSRRVLPRRHLSLGQRPRGSPSRTALRPAHGRLTASRPTPGPAVLRLAPGARPQRPAPETAATCGSCSAGSGEPRAAGVRGSGDRAERPHSPRVPGRGSCPQPLGISRALLLRLASRPAEICHLLSPRRKLAARKREPLQVLRSPVILPFWRPKLGCSPPRAAADALRCPLCSA